MCVCAGQSCLKDRQIDKKERGGKRREGKAREGKRRRDTPRIIRPRLHQNPLSARIAQPEIMHQRALPHLDSMPASEFLLTYQSMEASVPVIDIAAREVSSQTIFFNPVQFEVAERFAVPASDGGEAVFAIECLFEERFLVFDRA